MPRPRGEGGSNEEREEEGRVDHTAPLEHAKRRTLLPAFPHVSSRVVSPGPGRGVGRTRGLGRAVRRR